MVSEFQLLRVLGACGNVVDHRMCGDPNELGMRWAFIELDSEDAVSRALTLDGAILGGHSIKVVRSKTAIVPVNSSLLSRSEEEELERCRRTVYVTNVDPDCEPGALAAFFAQQCGDVAFIDLSQLVGQDTQAALIEFVSPDGAVMALRCAGQHIKALPLGVSPLYNDGHHRAAPRVFVRDLAQEVGEEAVARAFSPCGVIEECRMCSDPNCATLRFAFIQFDAEEAVGRALTLDGTVLGGHSIKVARSRTAIVPVNCSLLPRSEEELERCRRTVHVTNVDPECEPGALAAFFAQQCGEVNRIHVAHHAHGRVAFVEFADELGAGRALNCGGARILNLPIRVSPSKTPLALATDSTGSQPVHAA